MDKVQMVHDMNRFISQGMFDAAQVIYDQMIGKTSGDSNKYEARYEFTPHKLNIALKENVDVKRENIFEDGSAFILYNLLTKEECLEIQQLAKEMGLKDSGYSSRIRVCDRVSAMGADLGSALFERAKPFLNYDIEVVKDESLMKEGGLKDFPVGTYTPVSLNPCFRVVRYSPGGFFFPHFDGGFQTSPTKTSLKTFMLYLNDSDEFKGGPTNFYNSQQQHYEKPRDENVIHRYYPKTGSCLVFNHCLTHDGGILLEGEKWLLRTEVMYNFVEKK